MLDAFPIITERLSLRLHAATDAGWLHSVYSRPEVARYLLDEPWTEQEASKKLDQRLVRTDLDSESGALALVIDRAGTPVGDVALWFTNREQRIVEIGWVIDTAHAGRGYAAEAVSELLSIAFDHYRVHRVVAQMDARNAASAKLSAKVGMHHEAHLRQDWWSKGEWTDTLIYAMLASDRD